VYGEANPALTFLYSGWMNSDDPDVLATKPVAATAVNELSPVDIYTDAITLAGGADENYDFAYVAADLAVTKATITVTADDQTKVYGEANPALTLTYSGFVNGDDNTVIDTDPAVITTADELSGVGSFPIILAGGADNNYLLTRIDGSLSVEKALLTATADDKEKIYSEANPLLTISYDGFKNSDNITDIDLVPAVSTTATDESDAGVYVIALSSGSDNNYTITEAEGTLTIGKAVLTVTSENKERIYSEANPALTVTYNGFVNGENEDVLDTRPTASTIASPAVNTGIYPIVSSGGDDNNYSFLYIDGNMTVNRSLLSITAVDKTKKYGEVNPALTYSYSGFKNSDDESDLDVLPVIETAALSTSPVGSIPVTLTGGSDNNYDYTNINGVMTITKAPLVISSDNKTKVYGEENPSLTVSYSGFVNGEDNSALIQAPLAEVNADITSSTGDYAIGLAEAASENYEIEYNEGYLTITQAPLMVTATSVTKVYLDEVPLLTVDYSGFVNSDTQDMLDVPAAASTDATQGSDAGSYDIIAEGGEDNNYAYTYVDGVLTIVKADQVITFVDIPEGLRTTQEYQMEATSTSGLPVSFESSETEIVTLSGSDMAVNKEGTVQITASQSGNYNWNPAVDVIQTVITLPTFDNIRSLFTPNDDGMNDTWYLPDIEQYGDISVQIYNRFGKLLYESASYKNDWNGTYNGAPLPSASYYYLIKSSEKGMIKGVVNLVR